MDINICICTCWRDEMLEEALESVANQRFQRRPAPRVRIIVIDNAGRQTTRALCERFAARTGADCRHVVEPQRGISFARNRALRICGELGSGDIVFIDDDEVAAPDWLETLLDAQEQTGADIVQGVCLPVFPPSAPGWMSREGYFIKPSSERYRRRRPYDTGQLTNVATYNVLIKRTLLYPHGPRPIRWFDPRFALTGGEDTVFFADLINGGAAVAFARYSIVHETLPPDRANLAYLLRRRWATGASAARRYDRSLRRHLLFALRKMGVTTLKLAAGVASHLSIAGPFRYFLYEAAFYTGYIHGSFGGTVTHYGQSRHGRQPAREKSVPFDTALR